MGNFLSAGSRPVTLDLAAALEALGHRVLLTSGRTAQAARLADMIATAVRHRHDYDTAVVDVYSGRAFVYAEAVAAILGLLGKRYVLTLHGGNLPVFARRWPGRVRRLLASADRVTAPSAYLAGEMRAYRGDLLTIPNGLDTRPYGRAPRAGAPRRLLWLRAFHRIYNPVLAVEAMARLATDHQDLRLAMVGPDKGDGSLASTRAAVERLGLADRVEFPGRIAKADVARWMNAADIFINTADVDNAPVSVIEGMAAGLCVVSTEVGGVPHLVTDGHDGLLVPPRDPDALAAAIHRVLADPRLAARLSTNARRRAAASDWRQVVPQWVALLSSLRAGPAQ